MLKLIAELSLAPALVGTATLAGNRWGQQIAGLVSGLPVVVGPLLLIAAQQRGLSFAATAANGVLLGLPALGGFALAYARFAHLGSGVAVITAWASAAAVGALIGLCPFPLPFPAGLLVAAISLSLALRLMPRSQCDTAGPVRSRSRRIPLRMGATAALVVLLWVGLAVLGPAIGGMLAALPTVVSVLAFCAHRDGGMDGAVSLLRGALAGMASFVGFCAVVGWLLPSAGLVATFLVGTAVGLCLQAVAQDRVSRSSRTALRRTAAPAA